MISNLLTRSTDRAADTDVAPIASAATQVANGWTTKLLTAGIFVCIGLGPIGAFVGAAAYNKSSQPPVSAPAVADGLAGERAAAGEYAQRVVTTWLTATREDAEALNGMVADARLASFADEPFEVADPAVAGVELVDGAWAVAVAVTVTDVRDVQARRYFQVPVSFVDGAATALMLPTPIAGPSILTGAATNLYRSRVDLASSPAQAVTGFLGAYLTGTGDVARYVTPGVNITGLEPAPYTQVDLTDLRTSTDFDTSVAPVDGQEARLLAVATASVAKDQSVPVAYALTVTARAGRWEITAIDQAPAGALNSSTTAPSGAALTPEEES